MIWYYKKNVIAVTAILLAQFLLAHHPILAAVPNQQCKSDVKGFCAYSSPKKDISAENKRGLRLFAAEADSFVVPGIEFLNIPGNASLGDIFIKLYTYLLALVGISALLMFIWGGIAYTTATEGGVKEAKQKIGNAAFGLAIALLGYLGLITINPDLVGKLNLVLEPITSEVGLPIEGAGCTVQGGCEGIYQKRSDGKMFCKTNDPDCAVNNTNVCTVKIACPGTEIFPCNGKATLTCPNGITVTCPNKTAVTCPYISTVSDKFNSPSACRAGCGPGRDPCPGSESFDIIDLKCGSPDP